MRPKTATGWTALILGLLLVVSNAWWLYVSVDDAITASYRDSELVLNQQALDDALRLMPLVDSDLGRAKFVAKAEELFEDESFEKDGCVWVGNLGLKFDEDDRLVHASPNWSFAGAEDPCFPE